MAIDPKYTPIFTNVGLTKIANAMANGTKIVLDKFAIGDANGTDYTPNATQFSLVHELTRIDLRTVWYADFTDGSRTLLEISALIKSGTISATIKEVGIYDKAGDLIIIARTPDRQTITADNLAININYTTQISIANNERIFAVTQTPSGDFVTLFEYNGHVTDFSNPHNTTKAQVGLGLAENTTDISKNVNSALKLTNARYVNGILFDGTANIELEDRVGASVAAAATTVIGNAGQGDYLKITGAVNIASFGTAGRAGIRRTLRFDSALTIVNSANLSCPAGADIGVLADTIIEVVAETTSTWKVVSITHPSLSMAELGYLDGVTSGVQGQLNLKAPLASPALTGTPTAPTATVGTNTTQLATTAFTAAGLALKADVAQTMYIGTTALPINRASATLTLSGVDIGGNSSTATKFQTARTINGVSFDGTANINVNTVNNEVIKFDSGINEGTDLYTFNGSTAKTIDIKAGTNVTLTKAAGVITISANDTAVAVSEITGMGAGASTFLTTPSSANLASMLTDETGTGLAVFNTSPTLVTPNIGVATGTSFNSIVGLSSTAPLVAGTATVGTGTTVARADHVHPVQTSVSGNAGTATQLATARNISASGDATAIAQSFNGTADITLPLVLANSGVTAGSYSKVTVDSKGRVTVGLVPTMEDIPDATFKRSVRCATTANLAATYASNVLTMSAVGAISIDGITIALNDRILIKDQTTSAQNGIYVVTTLGTASVATVFTRSNDANTTSKIASALVAVDSGTLNGGKLYDNDFKTTDTLGTTNMPWQSNLDFGHLLNSNSTSIGTVLYNGTTANAGAFDGGTTTPTGTNRLNYGGYFYPAYINLTGSGETTTASSHVFVETGSDGFVRPKTLANFKTEIFASPTLVTPNIGVATGTSFNSITALSSTTPLMDGVAAIGTSTTVARADHVHGSDTTKANLSGATFTGAVSGTTFTGTTFTGALSGNATTATTATNVSGGTVSATTGTFTNDLTVGGNLTVNGTTTTINSTVVAVDDINIELGSVATPTDATANGGGITLKGTTDKSISWSAANGWNSSENWNLVTGKTYKINGVDILSATALGSSVTGSSLTSVGTVTSGTWSGAFGAVSGANLTNLTAANLAGTIPSAVLGNSTVNIGTTAVALNRASGALALTGITSIDGNSATATKLATARTISGVSFDGTANIDIEDRIGTAIASAATVTIGTKGLGDYIHITGTTGITNLGTAAAAGIRRTLIFDGALVLTHNATSLICPGSENITTMANTVIEVVAETTANWRVISITHPSVAHSELGYLDGVTSSIQTQLNGKANLSGATFTGAITATSVNGITGMSTTATDIKMDGVQSAGSLNTVAKADHIHPTDTSRAPINNPVFTGDVTITGGGYLKYSTNQGGIATNATYNSGWKYITADKASFLDISNNQFSYKRAATGTAGGVITWDNAFLCDANNNFGIGTNTPDLFSRGYSGKILGISGQQAAVCINSALGSTAYLDLGLNGARLFGITTDITGSNIMTSGATPLVLGTNGIENMRITPLGNVGIGKIPSYKFDVSMPTDGNTGVKFQSLGGTNNPWLGFSTEESTKISRINAGGSTSGVLSLAVDNVERIGLYSSGNIALGNISPSPMVGNSYLEMYRKGHGLWVANPNDVRITSNYYYDGQYKFAGTGYATSLDVGSQTGKLTLMRSSASGNTNGLITWVQSLALDDDTNLHVGEGVGSGSYHQFAKTTSASNSGNAILACFGSGLSYSFACYNVTGVGVNGSNAAMKVYADASTGKSINAAGTINAQGADYAEYENNNGIVFSKGQIVGFKEDGTLTDKYSESIRFAIKSTNPSLVGGDSWGNEEAVGVRPEQPARKETMSDEDYALIKIQYDIDIAIFEEKLEIERLKVDRIAYSGKVPLNIYNAKAGQYVIAIEKDGLIDGKLVDKSDMTFADYQDAVGRVNKILKDGRCEVAVIIH